MGLERINDLRKAKGITLDALSSLSGVPKSTLSKITSGQTKNPNLETVQAIARALGVPVDYFDEDTEMLPANLYPLSRRMIPVLGNVAAGTPIWADEEHDEYIDDNGTRDADFALRVIGDSMSPLIEEGDFVYVRRQPEVCNGQIAVVLDEDSATLKYFYNHGVGIQLVSHNPAYPPMAYTGEAAKGLCILGLAIAYKRSLLKK